MIAGCVVAFRDLSQDESTPRNGRLISSGPGWAEIELTDAGTLVPAGTAVGWETGENSYLGLVETIQDGKNRLRVRVEHCLALPDVASIQKLWSQEEAN